MNVLIVSTIDGGENSGAYVLWSMVEKAGKWKPYGGGFELSINGDKVIILKQREEKLGIPPKDFTDAASDRVRNLINSQPAGSTYFIAVHGELMKGRIDNFAKGAALRGAVYVHNFTHKNEDKIWKLVEKLVIDADIDSFNEACLLVEQKAKLNYGLWLAHRVTSILQPVLIDLDGLDKHYWDEIVEIYRARVDGPFEELAALIPESENRLLNRPVSAKVNSILQDLAQYETKAELLKDLKQDDKFEEVKKRLPEFFQWAGALQKSLQELVEEENQG